MKTRNHAKRLLMCLLAAMIISICAPAAAMTVGEAIAAAYNPVKIVQNVIENLKPNEPVVGSNAGQLTAIPVSGYSVSTWALPPENESQPVQNNRNPDRKNINAGLGTASLDSYKKTTEVGRNLINEVEKGAGIVIVKNEDVAKCDVVGNNAGAPVSLLTMKDGSKKIILGTITPGADGKSTVTAASAAADGASPGKTAKPTKTDKPGVTPQPTATLKPGQTPKPGSSDAPYPQETCYDYEEPVYAPDFSVCEVVPLLCKKDQRVLVAVNVVNNGSLDANTDVSVTIGTEKITMTNITMPAGGCHTLSFGHYTPKTLGKQKISVMVNPSHPGAEAPHTITCNTCLPCDPSISWNGPLAPQEYGYGDNAWSGSINITQLPVVPNPKNPAPEPKDLDEFISEMPQIEISATGGTGSSSDVYTDINGRQYTVGNNRTTTDWIDSKPTGADKTYHASVAMDVKVMDRGAVCTALKSGYGFSVDVAVDVATDYPIADKVEAPKKVLCYIPDWGGYDFAIALKRTDNGGAYARHTTWTLPVNAESGAGLAKWYVPVWWPDKTDYKILIAAKGVYTPGGEITCATDHTIRIDSNMYTDDYTPGG